MSDNSSSFKLNCLDFQELINNGLISSMFQCETMGVLIRNFLSLSEMTEIKTHLSKYLQLDEIMTNATFPESFNREVRDKVDLTYLEGESNPIMTFILNRLLSSLSHMENGKKAKAVSDQLPGTFRIISPEHCHIDLHCGNQFLHRFPEFYQELGTGVDVQDQLSFFTLINKPDDGGKLAIYNAKWSDFDDCDLKNQTLLQRNLSGAVSVDNFEVCMPEINPGDLLIFQGGQYWHKVIEVYGKAQRITFGGFIGKDKLDDAVVIWS